MQTMTKMLLTAGLGAATMYYLDPAQGRRRRAVARDRIEQGRDSLQQTARTARVVGRDVGHTADRAIHGLRAVGHDVSERADRAIHGLRAVSHDVGDRAGHAARRARTFGHDVGERAGRLTHGLRSFGHGTRDRAAGAVASAGSLFERGQDRGARVIERSRPALRLAGIPVKWLLVAGIGASAMYFLDPSQGLYRRARFRSRFLQNTWRKTDDADVGHDTAERTPTDESQQAGTRASNSGMRAETPERPLPG